MVWTRRPDADAGFDEYVAQLDAVLDEAGTERTAICGVSFGGLVALRYAAARPERVSALILASVPGPGWRPSTQQTAWLARPWLSTPAFVLSSPARVWPEVSAALPPLSARIGFFVRQGLRCAAAPLMPPLMASRMRAAAAIDFAAESRRVQAPTLILTGEEQLDRVVPVSSTRMYASYMEGARCETLRGTGHMAVMTQPQKFAAIVSEFVHAHHH
jgi:pimeloyl-ACP methyl ester carboxylesterase